MAAVVCVAPLFKGGVNILHERSSLQPVPCCVGHDTCGFDVIDIYILSLHIKLMLCCTVEAIELQPPLSLLSVCPNEDTRPFTVVLLGEFLLPQSHPMAQHTLSLSLLHVCHCSIQTLNALGETRQWLEYDQRREACVRVTQTRVLWPEKLLNDASQAPAQQDNEYHSDGEPEGQWEFTTGARGGNRLSQQQFF